MTKRKARTKSPVKIIPPVEDSIVEIIKEVLAPDLQAPIDATSQTPQFRAQMVRRAFGARGWPNKEYPGTVRDFLNEHNIPIL